MTTLNTVTPSDTPTPCYTVYAYFKGIRNRARKVERHQIKLGERIALESIVDDQGNLTPEAIHHFSLEATCRMRQGYRDFSGSYDLTFNYEVVRVDSGLTCTEYEPFGPNHHRLTLRA